MRSRMAPLGLKEFNSIVFGRNGLSPAEFVELCKKAAAFRS